MTGSEKILEDFTRRLLSEWLPNYCNDKERQYSLEGFKESSIKVTPLDALDFIRAIDANLVTDNGGGRYVMPKSSAHEVIFWEGSKKFEPRHITLWLEPIITIAAIARLHFDYGWPINCLGTQSPGWEFDLIAYNPENLDKLYIAGEVKKTSKELDTLIDHMNKFCAGENVASDKEINAHNKWKGLHDYKAPYFWALGPGGDSRIFEVLHSEDRVVALIPTLEEVLMCKKDE